MRTKCSSFRWLIMLIDKEKPTKLKNNIILQFQLCFHKEPFDIFYLIPLINHFLSF
ncbi:hypothetical protein Hanom_Chr03g00269571 [Helianthus anomalus]